MALQLVTAHVNTPLEATVSVNERSAVECVDEAIGPSALEYLVDRIMIAIREGTPVPLRVVLEDALRELHPGALVFLRDVIPPHSRPQGFSSQVPWAVA